MSTFVIITLLILFVAGAVAGMFMQKAETEQKNTLLDQLNNLPEFHPERTIIKRAYNQTVSKGISLDSSSKKICLIIGNTLTVKPFTDIVEAQIVVDGTTVTKTSRSSQAVGMAVGAALGGGLGLLIGGLTGSKSTATQVKNVSIKLLINDLKFPVHEINMVELLSTGKTPIDIALKEAEEWDNILKIVLFQAQEERKTKVTDNEEGQKVAL